MRHPPHRFKTTDMKVFAYIRVSTQLQTHESQKYEITRWCASRGMKIDNWVTESVSGTVAWEKRSLGRAIRKMENGDTIVCTELSRLGRNLLMIMSILNSCTQRGIMIRSIKDNFELSDSLNSKIIAFAFGLAAEIERNLISQRTKEALAAKKASGIKLGRPAGRSRKVAKVLSELEKIRGMLDEGMSRAAVARLYGIHRNTLSRCLSAAESPGEEEAIP